MRLGRLTTLGLIFTAVAAVLVVRLAEVQLVIGPSLAKQGAAELNRTISLTPLRGEILDSSGQPLAIESPATLIYVITPEVTDAKGEATAMAPILKVPEATLQAELSASGWYHVIDHAATAAQVAALKQLFLPGIGYTAEQIRKYPDGIIGEPVLGWVNASQVGIAGVEQSYNQVLAGTPGQAKIRVDALGQPLPSYGMQVTRQPIPGQSIQLTINGTLQAYAQATITADVTQHKGTSGRIVIMNPNTGAVLALAQYPTVNPNQWQSAPVQAQADQAVEYAYPPGSIFKPMVAALALLDHVATLQSRYYDPGYKVVDGLKIHTWKRTGYGWLSFNGILAYSSDVGFMDLGLALGLDRFYAGLHLFHLDRPTGIDLPGEATGVWPPLASANVLDLAEMSFGQTLAITAIQEAAAVAAIADGGVWHTPHVVQAIISPSGQKRTLSFPSKRILPSWVAADEMQGMEQVVSSQGDAPNAEVAGYVVAGKTGTSQLSPEAKTQTYMASFIGVAPAPHPQVLILLEVNNPQNVFNQPGYYYYGDWVVVPTFPQLMSNVLRVLGVPPQTPLPQPAVAVTVPDLSGMALSTAEADASLIGLHLSVHGGGKVVTNQFPAAGATVNAGASVSVNTASVALGPGYVPDLLGLSMRQAALELSAAGLSFWPTGSGLAVGQSPAAGSKLAPGAVVRVTFALPEAPAPTVSAAKPAGGG